MDVWNKAQVLLKKSHKPTKTFLGSFPLTDYYGILFVVKE